MSCAKSGHSVHAMNYEVFVVIGGYNKNELTHCEEYTVAEDKWKLLPALNVPRAHAALAIMSNNLLYAIGGYKTSNTIEVLNYSERKAWELVYVSSEIFFDDSPAAFPASSNEILILCGANTVDSGIFNIETKIIKRHPYSKIADFYYHNAVSIIRKKAYILGRNGNMHIYDLATKELEELPYSSLIF
eukprot:TRINITY_DN8669_c0_g1_i2.p1 TRINITY_DN8669_c0_g1~~TRINITY_DN8669_c0_g1_i2.p1  ORF type:complete len:188 (+),score=34.03 TRINITY_DN8669_c0_g1_i2:218-781(+)